MSATNHVLMITGKRNTGKTKELIELINDAADVLDHHVVFVNREPLPAGSELHTRVTQVTGPRDRSVVDVFLDNLSVNPTTHVFFDNVPQGNLSDVIHLAAANPLLNIAFVVQDTTK